MRDHCNMFRCLLSAYGEAVAMSRATLLAMLCTLAACQSAEDVRTASPLLVREVAVGWEEMFACLTEQHQGFGIGHSPVARPRDRQAALLAFSPGQLQIPTWEMRIVGLSDGRSRVEHRTTVQVLGNWYGAREFNRWVPECEAAELQRARGA